MSSLVESYTKLLIKTIRRTQIETCLDLHERGIARFTEEEVNALREELEELNAEVCEPEDRVVVH